MVLFNDPQPWRDRTPAQAKALLQLQPCHVFEHVEYAFFIHRAACDLLIAVIAGLRLKIERCNRRPETLVIHRSQPVLDIIDVSEFFHETTIAKPDSQPQICRANSHSPWSTGHA